MDSQGLHYGTIEIWINLITLTGKGKLFHRMMFWKKLKPGLNIFLGTGMAEPRTLVKNLTLAETKKIQDLEFLQLGSFGDAASKLTKTGRHRLKSFFFRVGS